MKKKLPITIIIPCADDINIDYCIKSIDENVEILVALNGATKKVLDIINRHNNVNKLILKKRNLAKALNKAILIAKYDKVILIDSDCVFEKGAILKVYKGLRKHQIVKGKIIFEHNNYLTKITSDLRNYIYYDSPKPYNPFLCLEKRIIKKIGGYYFDERIKWTEDADLSQRINSAGINVNYIFSAKAYHRPISLINDLKSAYKYGQGKRLRVTYGVSKGMGTHFQKIPDVISKKGFWVGIHYFIWNISYSLAYLVQAIRVQFNTELK